MICTPKIKASELRIGNLLEWEDDSHDIIAVKSIVDEGSYHIVTFKGGGAQLDEFVPIRLTDKWLIKAGFYDDSYANFVMRLPESDTLYFVVGFKEYAHISLTDTFDVADYSLPIKLCKYVHQLQNLYYALTGQELAFDK